MQLLFFLLVYPVLWMISILPFRILYIVSDITYIIVYHIIGYRKSTVRHNLQVALPNYTAEQRLEVEKKSYKHMCDMFLEMIKTMTITTAELDRRYIFTNLEVYLELEKKDKSIALLCAHYASYEWAVSMNHHITFTGYAIYKKIANEYFDKLVRDIRSKFKAQLITTKETVPIIKHNAVTGKKGVYGFASDQSPKASRAMHWTNFLGVESAVHTGGEMLAKQFDMNVIFLKTRKVKRGYYEGTFELLVDNPKEFPDYKITEEFLRRVEKQIYEAPEFYLWTHKRWKAKPKDRTRN